MAKPPPKFIIPAAPPKKSSASKSNSLQGQYTRYVNANPLLKKNGLANTIWTASKGAPNANPLWVAAVVLTELKSGKPIAPPNVTWPGGVTAANNVNSQIGYLAYEVGQHQGYDVNGIQDFYTRVWHGTGDVTRSLKGYPVQLTGLTAAQTVTKEVVTQQAKLSNKAEQYQKTAESLSATYLAYTGKPPTQAEVQSFIKNPISQTQLEMNLSNTRLNPLLTKSPIWKQNADRYIKYYQDVFGPNAKPPDSVIQHGIVYSLDETAFKNELQHDQIKGQQDYSKSEEYQQLFAQYKASYASIYGMPDENGTASIKMAIKGGWTDTQWQNWLRNQPEYKNSAEYKTRSINLAQSMGLLTGGEAQNILAAAVPQKTPGGPAEEQPTPPATISTVAAKPTNTPPAPASPVIKPTPQGGVHVPGGTI